MQKFNIKTMQSSHFLKVLLGLLILNWSWVNAQNRNQEIKKVKDATRVLEDLAYAPEEGIPPTLLARAEAVAIFPKVIKGGLIVGGRYGKGVVTVKDEEGQWSNPAFLKLAGGSIGLQIGGQSADIVLLFFNRETVLNIGKSDFTLGADAAVAAGPVGRQVGASTNYKLEAEVYSYSRARGLFAGLSVEGSSISVNEKANQDFYDENTVNLDDIFHYKDLPAPEVVKDLKAELQKMSDKQ